MTISINDNFPNQELRILIDGEVQNVNSADYFSGKKNCFGGSSWCFYTNMPSFSFTRFY